jgi:hypothetical protein
MRTDAETAKHARDPTRFHVLRIGSSARDNNLDFRTFWLPPSQAKSCIDTIRSLSHAAQPEMSRLAFIIIDASLDSCDMTDGTQR